MTTTGLDEILSRYQQITMQKEFETHYVIITKKVRFTT